MAYLEPNTFYLIFQKTKKTLKKVFGWFFFYEFAEKNHNNQNIVIFCLKKFAA